MDEPTTGADSAPSSSHESAETRETATRPRANWVEWLRQGLRASTLRTVQRLPEGPTAWPMLMLVAASAVLLVCASRLEVEGPATFDVRSWLFGWATDAFLIFGVWLVLGWARERTTHPSAVAAWYLLFIIATLPVSLVGHLLLGYLQDWWAQGGWSAWALYAALWVWLGIAIWRVSQAVTRSTLVAASLLVCTLAVQILAGWQLATQEWQPVDSYDDQEFASLELSQEVFESQQGLLEDALQAIVPSRQNERQTFGLIYAPYSEDVFLRESAMVQEVLEERFGARGRVVRLLNNPATAAEIPWATTPNFERSLRALAEAMNPERDVLVVYLTSHGGADFKLAAEHWPLKVEDLTAEQLRTMLDDLGIRHRVIAVSACYSGGWIEPLQNDDTLIMTAADKDHTSYGCGSKSELTFFGRAMFDEQLRKTLSFEEAFNAAVPVIKQREIEAKKDDGFSNPQIAVGKNIRGVLEELTGAGQ